PERAAPRAVYVQHHDAHHRPREHQELHGRLPLRRASDGDARRDVGALSTFYPDAKLIHDADSRKIQTHRLLAKMPTIAAFAHRHAIGMPYAYPDNDLSYTGNFLNMMFKVTELKYRPDPVLERALDVLFILHADHEQNCSANAMR